MPTIADLGRQIKEQYPGSYDDMSDAELGRKMKDRFPGSHDDFTDTPLNEFAREREQRQQAAGGPSVMDNPPGEGPSLLTRGVQGGMRLLKDAGPSVVGGQVFRYGGRFIPGVRNLPEPAREGLGSATGEAISQLIDKTKPFNFEQIVAAGAVGTAANMTGQAVPRASIPVGKGAFRWLFRGRPGTAEVFQQVGADELFEDITWIAARTQDIIPEGMTVDDLWNTALRGNQVSVPMSNTRTAAQEIAAEIGLAEEMGFLESGWKKTISTLATKPGDPTLRQLDLTRRGLEDFMGVFKDQPNLIGRQAKYVLSRVFQDIEDAAARGIPEAVTLQQALSVSRRELSVNSLLEYLDSPRAMTPPAPGENTQFMKINRVLDDLRRVRSGVKPPRELALLRVGLSETELDDMISTVEFWNEYTSARTAPKGTNVGSGPSLAAGATGFALSGDPQVAAALVMGRWAFVRAIAHPQGRRALRELIREGADVNLVDLGIQAMGQIGRTLATPSMQDIYDSAKGFQYEKPR